MVIRRSVCIRLITVALLRIVYEQSTFKRPVFNVAEKLLRAADLVSRRVRTPGMQLSKLRIPESVK